MDCVCVKFKTYLSVFELGMVGGARRNGFKGFNTSGFFMLNSFTVRIKNGLSLSRRVGQKAKLKNRT